jgi:hypothetical protein
MQGQAQGLLPTHHNPSPWLLPATERIIIGSANVARTAKPMTSSKRTPLTQMRRLKKRSLQLEKQGRN